MRPRIARSVLLPLLLLACSSEEEEEGELRLDASIAARSLPPPTEHVLGEDAEQNNKDARRRWFEQMHRTAPGDDWREIERRNGLAEMARRNQLAAGPQFLLSNAWGEIGSKNQAGRMMC